MHRIAYLFTLIALAGVTTNGIALGQTPNVRAWGFNYHGELGNGMDLSTVNQSVAAQVSGLTGVVAIAGGGLHSWARESDGTVWAWGNNQEGELGNGSNANSNVPVQVSGLTGAVAIAGGGLHSLALKSDGTVWAWGYNHDGEIGN